LFTIDSALSLLVMILLSAIWIQSHFVYSECSFVWNLGQIGNGRSLTLAADRGGFLASWRRETSSPQSSDGKYWPEITGNIFALTARPLATSVSEAQWFNLHRIQVGPHYASPGQDITSVFGPLWPLVILAAILPAIWIVLAVRRAKRGKEGFCGKCGYDLRASPERCSECGTLVSTGSARVAPADGQAQAN
jgi:hypothetical protein